MKNRKINIRTITIIVLIGIIISLIFAIFNVKNNNIEKQEIAKEQLGETTGNNAYVSMETHLSELNEKQQEIDNIKNIAEQATATQEDILEGKTAYVKGNLITGTLTKSSNLDDIELVTCLADTKQYSYYNQYQEFDVTYTIPNDGYYFIRNIATNGGYYYSSQTYLNGTKISTKSIHLGEEWHFNLKQGDVIKWHLKFGVSASNPAEGGGMTLIRTIINYKQKN